MGGRELNSCGSGYPGSGFCEHGVESTVFIKARQFLTSSATIIFPRRTLLQELT
jgi:hypothetical protein